MTMTQAIDYPVVLLVDPGDGKGEIQIEYRWEGGWYNATEDKSAGKDTLIHLVSPNVKKVKFGTVEFTAYQWRALGSPLSLNSVKLAQYVGVIERAAKLDRVHHG